MADSHELTTEAEAPNAARKEPRRSVVKKISWREVPTFVEQVKAPDGSLATIVAERLPRDANVTDEEAASWIRDARAAAALQHRNVVRGRAISVRADEIVVACDFVEGERLCDLLPLPLDVGLAIVVDVLSGLAAIHRMTDAKGQSLALSHG